jgi:hypothetical protein
MKKTVNKKIQLSESFTHEDLEILRRIIRKEVSEIMFDMYKKRNIWVK